MRTFQAIIWYLFETIWWDVSLLNPIEHNLHSSRISISVLQDDLIELYGIFGDVLHAALDLIDHNRIKLYTLASRRRQIVEIQAAHTSSYSFKFFPHTNYCPCNAFVEQVIRNADTYTCRHVLAAKLAMISRRNIEEIVADDVFNYLILTIGDPS